MKRLALVVLFAGLMLSGCVVAPAPPGYGGDVAPPLPAVIELGIDPYYSYGGFYYFYDHDRWHYSRHRGGPWTELPRSHWPKEIRRRGMEDHRGGEFRHEREER